MRASRRIDDVALFRDAKKSEQAFELLYGTYAPGVYAWFRSHATASGAEAADLTAEAFARVILGIHRFRGSRPGSGTAWLLGIVRHLACDYARRRQVEGRARMRLKLEPGYAPSASDDLDARLSAEQASAEIREAFAALTIPQQTALQLRVVDELSYEEIAELTNSTSQAARLHVMRGLRRLRNSISRAREEQA
jgi:RNA polymerase sigma-70 factor (ECF subfamily)